MKSEYKIKLPSNLTEEEQIKLFKEKTKEARNKLISSNIRLVVYEVYRRFNNTIYEIEDLISIGIIGLIKGIDTYDINKSSKSSSYLVRCIDNQILMFLRGNRQTLETSLNQTIYIDQEGNKLEFADILQDEFDLQEKIETNEAINILKKIIYNLNPIERQIIMLYYGFDNNEQLSQKEIGEILNLSQSYISRILKRTLQQIKNEIEITYGFQEKVKKLL